MPPLKSRTIAVLGYRSVGKSSLTIQFLDSYDPTIEDSKSFSGPEPEPPADLLSFPSLPAFTNTMKGQQYDLQLVDTAGQTCTIDVSGYTLAYSLDPGSDGAGRHWFWVWYQTSSWQVWSHQNIQYRFHPDGSVVVSGSFKEMVGNVQDINPKGSDPLGLRIRVLLDSLVCFCKKPIILVGSKKDLHLQRFCKALAESWSAAFLESSEAEVLLSEQNQQNLLTVSGPPRRWRVILEVEQMERSPGAVM